jgi:hypothetical protein
MKKAVQPGLKNSISHPTAQNQGEGHSLALPTGERWGEGIAPSTPELIWVTGERITLEQLSTKTPADILNSLYPSRVDHLGI